MSSNDETAQSSEVFGFFNDFFRLIRNAIVRLKSLASWNLNARDTWQQHLLIRSYDTIENVYILVSYRIPNSPNSTSILGRGFLSKHVRIENNKSPWVESTFAPDRFFLTFYYQPVSVILSFEKSSGVILGLRNHGKLYSRHQKRIFTNLGENDVFNSLACDNMRVSLMLPGHYIELIKL